MQPGVRRPKAHRRSAITPVLLSAFVCPGLGQWVNGRRWRALVFFGGSLVLLVLFARLVFVEASSRIPEDPSALLDPTFPLRLAGEIERAQASSFLWLTIGLIVIWLVSVGDAWRDATRAARRPGGSSPDVGTPPIRKPAMASQQFCSHCGVPLPSAPPVTCAACDTSHWLDAKPCGGALVTHRGRLLLLRRAHDPWRGCWDLPSGFCGPREHPRDAAAREVREETGLTVDVGAIVGIWMDDYDPNGAEPEKVTMNVYFQARVRGAAEPRTDPNEAAEIAWFAPGQLPQPLAFPGHLPAVLRVWRTSLSPIAAERE